MDIFTIYFFSMEVNLIDRLKKELKQRKVSVPSFAEKTGIPKDRVYKWLKRATGKIDHEDAVKVEAWLNGQLDNVPRGTSNQDTALKPTVETLSRSIEKSNDARLIEADNIRRLINLLEKNLKPEKSPFPKSGTPLTETGTKTKKI